MGSHSRLTIITINRNNKSGLEETMKSVSSQTCIDFEYVVVDGFSTDGSVDVICRFRGQFGERLKWISEPDDGIYNAMNKGIMMASGEYVEFLNSGDSLASEDVVSRMYTALEHKGKPSILYGNMLKEMQDGTILRDKSFAGRDITFLGFFTGTLNHSPAYIRRDLFVKYGMYDEALKIVSDWKWYLQAIVLGEEKPCYIDIDVTRFDMNGVSETNKEMRIREREQVLAELIPPPILLDYEQWAFTINHMKRLKRHPWADKIVWFIERCLFKLEKAKRNQSRQVEYQ